MKEKQKKLRRVLKVLPALGILPASVLTLTHLSKTSENSTKPKFLKNEATSGSATNTPVTQDKINQWANAISADYDTEIKNSYPPALWFSNALEPSSTPTAKELTDEQKSKFTFTITDGQNTYHSVWENGKNVFKELGVYVKNYYFSNFTIEADRETGPRGSSSQIRNEKSLNLQVSLGSLNEAEDSSLTETLSNQITINGFIDERSRISLLSKDVAHLFDEEPGLFSRDELDRHPSTFFHQPNFIDELIRRMRNLLSQHPEFQVDIITADTPGLSQTIIENGKVQFSYREPTSKWHDKGYYSDNEGWFSYKYRLISTREGLTTQIAPSGHLIRRITFTTPTSETTKVNTLTNELQIEYKDKNRLLNFPSTFEINEQTKQNLDIFVYATPNERDDQETTEKVKHTAVYENGEFIFKDLKLKVSLLEIANNITNENDETGIVNLKVKLKSTKEDFEKIESEETTREATGFRTEQGRLNALFASKREQIINSLFTSEEKNALPSTVNKATLINKLNALFPSDYAKTSDDLITTFDPNNADGTLTIKYKLNSTRNDLTHVQSSDDSGEIVIPGFYSTNAENQRISDLVSKVTSADYQNKTNVLAAKEFSNIVANDNSDKHKVTLTQDQISKLTFTIQDGDQTYTSTYQNNRLEFPQLGVFVRDYYTENFNNANDNIDNNGTYVGQLPLFIGLSSLKTGMADLINENSSPKVTISGFKAETVRLIEIQKAKKSEVEAIFTEEEKTNKRASAITREEVEEKLKTIFSNELTESDALIRNSSIGQLIPDDSKGILGIIITIKSTRDNLTDVKANENLIVRIPGFISEQTKLDDLINRVESVNYNPKDFLLNYPTSQTLEANNLTVTIRDAEGTLHTSQLQDGEVIFPTLDMKLADVTFAPLTNANDANGSTNVTFKLQTTLATAKNAKSATTTTKELSGFKTEVERLNTEILNHATNENVNVTNKENRSPSEVTKAEIATLLNNLYNTPANAQIVESDITLNPNNRTGVLEVTYKLTSTRNDLTEVKSSNSRTLTLDSFLDADGEKRRLDDLATNHITFSYTGASDILADFNSTQLSEENLVVTINDVVGTYNSRRNSFTFAAPINAEVTEIYFNDNEDRNGTANVEFKLVSTKPNLRNVTTELKTKAISGFKIEKTRLSELATAKATELANVQDPKVSKKAASELTKREIADLLTSVLTRDQARIRVEDIQSVSVNNQAGEATVIYKINSAREADNLQDVVTEQTYTKTFSGFITLEQEQSRLEEILSTALDTIDYTDKDNWPTNTTFENSNVTYLLNDEKQRGLATDIENKVEVSAIDFSNKKDLTGKVDITLTLTSTRPGFENVTTSNSATVTGFATEVNRLNRILVGEEHRIPLPVRIDFLAPNDKTLRAASTYTPEEIKNLLQPYYDSSFARVENVQLSWNNKTGTLEATYTLSSTREGLESARSTKTKTHRMNGFKTEEQERQRLARIFEEIQVAIERKTNTPILSNLVLNDITLTVREENGTLNSENSTFTFNSPINAIAKNITITDLDDVNGSVIIKIAELASNEAGFENVSVLNTRDQSDDAGISRTVEDFLTESQRLDKLVDQNVGEITYSNSTVPKSQKLAQDVTVVDLTFSKDENENNWYKLLSDDATLTPDNRAGTVTITLPINSTRENLTTIKSTKKRTIVLDGFKTAYQDAIDNLNNLDKDNVAVTPPTDSNSKLPNSDDVKNKDNYSITINNNDDENIEAQIIGVVGYDEINGRTLVAYRLVDNNPEHLSVDNQKPTSKVFFKVVNGFKTEAERLNDLKENADASYTYTNAEKAKNSTFATAVVANDFTFDSTYARENKVTLESPELSGNNATGTVTTNYKLATAKTNEELFKITNDDLDQTAQNDLNTFANDNFATPTAEEYHVTVNNTHTENGFLTNEQDLVNKINALTNEINDKENLSSEEKAKLIADLNAIKDTFDSEAEENNTAAYQKAVDAISTINNKADETDEAKGTKINQVDTLYPNLNKAQRDQVKENIKNSNTLIDISNPELPTTSEVENDANALNEAMGQLNNKIAQEIEVKEHDKYTKAPAALKALYDAAIQAAKDLIPAVNNADGQNAQVPDLGSLTNWNIDNAAKPEDSNYNKAAVDELNRVINEILDQMNTLYEQKEAAKNEIDRLPYLSDNEKSALKEAIDNAPNQAEIQKLKDKGQNINDAKEAEINKIKALEYLSNDEKEKFTSELKNKDTVSSDNLDFNQDDQDSLETITNKATDTNTTKKNHYDEVINTYPHLNTAQQDAIRQAIKESNLEIIEGKNTPITQSVLDNAQSLDDSMATLRELKDAQPDILASNIYTKASDASKELYNKLIEAAKELANNANPTETNLENVEVEETTPNWSKTSVDKLNEAIINALKEVYKSAIDNLDNLSDDEKTAAKAELDKSTNNTLEKVQNIINDTTNLNTEKKALIDAVERTYPHLNASQQNAIKEAIKGANKDSQLSNDNNHPTVESVQNDAQALDNSMEKLANLEAAKETIKTLPAYLNATQESKAKYEKLIAAAKELLANQKPSDENVALIEDNFVNPETANWAKTSVDKLNVAIENSLKEIYLSAIDELPYLSDEEKVTAKNQINDSEQTKPLSEIFSDVLLTNNEKEQEIQNVSVNYPHLNTSQQEAVKKAIKNANKDATLNPNSPSVEDEKSKAQTLDDEMAILEKLNAAKEAIKESNIYVTATDESKAKYNNLTDAAESLINDQNPTNQQLEDTNINENDANWDKNNVKTLNDAIIHVLKEAYKDAIMHNDNLSQDEKDYFVDQLDKDGIDTLDKVQEIVNKAKEINDAKEDLINNVAKLYPHLNDSQQTSVQEEIKTANLNAEITPEHAQVSEVKENAQALDDSMAQLELRESAKNAIHTSDAYLTATNESKELYDKLINGAKELIDNQVPSEENVADIEENFTNPTTANWNKTNVDKFVTAIDNALKVLYKSAIDKLEYLTDAEKAQAKDEIDNPAINIQDTFNDAQKIDKTKANEVAQVDSNYPHLNAEQKQAVKDAIKGANLDKNTDLNSPNVNEVKNLAKKLDDSMIKVNRLEVNTTLHSETIANINNFANTPNNPLVNKDHESANKAIDNLNNALKEGIKLDNQFHALENAFEVFKNSDALSQEGQIIKQQLIDQINSAKELISKIQNPLDEVLAPEIIKLSNLTDKSQTYVDLVNALLEKDSNKYDQAMQKLIMQEKLSANNLSKLDNKIKDKEYFNNFDQDGKNKLSSKDLDLANNSLAKVIVTALNLKDKSLFWIPIILFIGGVLTFGIAAGIAKKKSKKTKH
ncbi:lipoprotein 17-related variable surface protein [Mycoplasmopsis columbina]|uniref:lipoprotein 17-related variable surface protein n=1 Tax=Mycoplasmopsis columbina TaxID=114881 RepID=UPI0004A6E3A4|nr:lipoprotein 17-related variable surface protein [Mycoplasmopsis columbina]VEU76923.1 ECM-binding protein homolog [Mycoplasmopsis columbina]